MLKYVIYSWRIMIKEKIYTLTNPMTGEVFYVGRTMFDLNKRLSAHMTVKINQSSKMQSYIDELNRNGVRAIIELVDELDGFDKIESSQLESYWIQQFAAWGFELCNVKNYNRKNFYPPWLVKGMKEKRKLNRVTGFTDLEKQLIKMVFQTGDDAFLGKQNGYSKERFRQYFKAKKVPFWAKESILEFYYQKARTTYEWYLNNVINLSEELKTA